jgi:hypothetical protein
VICCWVLNARCVTCQGDRHPVTLHLPVLQGCLPHAAATACSITDQEGRELATCGHGQCFGELALLNKEAR